MRDIGAITAIAQHHITAIGMLAQNASRRSRRTAEPAAALAAFLGDDQIDRPIGPDGQDIVIGSDIRIDFAMLHIGSEPPDIGNNRLAAFGVFGHFTRQRQQSQSQFKLDGRRIGAFGQSLAFGLFALAQLNIGTVTAIAHGDIQTGLRVLSQHFRPRTAIGIGPLACSGGTQLAGEFTFGIVGTADKGPELAKTQRQLARRTGRATTRVAAIRLGGEHMRPHHLVERGQHFGKTQFGGAFDGGRKIGPEPAHHVFPEQFVIGDPVEIFLELGRKIEFDIAGEERAEKGRHQHALVGGMQPLFIQQDIFAVFERAENGGIGGRTANAQLFHPLDQRGFGEARWRLGKVLVGLDVLGRQPLAFAHRRQAAGVLVIALVVAGFGVELQKTLEFDHLTRGAQIQRAARRNRGDLDGGALQLGRFHLACHGPKPDQFIEFGLLRLQHPADRFGMARHVGRAHRLMGFLRVFGFGGVFARHTRQIERAEFFLDHRPARGNRLGSHIDTVCTHIGDQTHGLATDIDAFIETLGHLHGAGRRHAELARGFLLQSRGREGRIGMPLGRLGLDTGHIETGLLERGLESGRLGAGADVETGDLLPVRSDQPRLEFGSGRSRQFGNQ